MHRLVMPVLVGLAGCVATALAVAVLVDHGTPSPADASAPELGRTFAGIGLRDTLTGLDLDRPVVEDTPFVDGALLTDALRGSTLPAAARSKVDRLPMPAARLGSAAQAGAAAHGLGGGVTINTRLNNAPVSIAMPILAYAAVDPDAGLPFDALLGPASRGPAPSPPATLPPPVPEEDGDVVELLPVPRPKPKLGDVVASLPANLPVPRGRPLVGLPPAKPDPAPTAAQVPGAVEPGAIAPPVPVQLPPSTANGETVVTASLGPPKIPDSSGSSLFDRLLNKPPETKPGIPTKTPFGVPFVLQTQSVETACLRPELVEMLRTIETHYGKKVVITSGYRDRGDSGSLHRRCAAADIIVPGVEAKALAVYARTIPNMGGVGTYCHPSMIHVDVGSARDWKYGCGSYFAMRDHSAGWGKPPQDE